MNVLIVSTNDLVRERWKSALQDEHQVTEAASYREMADTLARSSCDLVLLHRSMCDMRLLTSLAGRRYFVLSDIPDENEAISLVRHGAVGYANTYSSIARLREAVRSVLAGRVWVGQKVIQKIIEGNARAINEKSIRPPSDRNLSDREWEVALLVGKGRSNLEIAAELDISERTVKAHIGSIFKKTGTESRLQLALYVKSLLA
ncbi:MAG: response regulator transcription factor [Desulfobulbaceae bacterium]|nr:MAG: response regulator transcription factor [Desulfobulbaceae bacterium]